MPAFAISRVRFFWVTLFFVWLQLTIVPFLKIQGLQPDLLCLLVVFLAFTLRCRNLEIIAFSAGAAKDLLVHTVFGLEIASLVCAAVVLKRLVHSLEQEDLFLQMGMVFVYSFSSLIFFHGLSFLLQQSYGSLSILVAKSAAIALYTAFLTPPVFVFLRFIFALRPHERQYELF